MNVRSQSLVPLIKMLRSKGHDPAALLKQFDIPAAAEAELDFELSADTLEALYDEGARVLGDESLGVHLGQNLERGRYGVLEYLALNTPTFQQSIELLARFSRLINPLVRYALETDADEGRVSQHTNGRRHGLGRHLNEFNVIALLQMGRGILRQRWTPTRVWFAHPKPTKGLAELEKVFGMAHFTFDAPSNGFAVPVSLLQQPVPQADPKLLELLVKTASADLNALPANDTIVARVTHEVHRLMREGKPVRVSTVAKALKMSARTLQRRLMAENLDFLRLVDQVRESSAKGLLHEGKAQLAEVAFLLGYEDPHSFTRAFKRWTGVPPGQFAAEAQSRKGLLTRK